MRRRRLDPQDFVAVSKLVSILCKLVTRQPGSSTEHSFTANAFGLVSLIISWLSGAGYVVRTIIQSVSCRKKAFRHIKIGLHHPHGWSFYVETYKLTIQGL